MGRNGKYHDSVREDIIAMKVVDAIFSEGPYEGFEKKRDIGMDTRLYGTDLDIESMNAFGVLAAVENAFDMPEKIMDSRVVFVLGATVGDVVKEVRAYVDVQTGE